MAEKSMVRIAGAADEDALVEHCRLHDEENGVYGVDRSVFPFDPAEARETVRRGILKQGVIIGVIGDGPVLEGSIAITIAKLWHTNVFHLEGLWTFVHPNFRKSKHARALSDFGKQTAVTLKAPLIDGVVANHRTEEKVRLYQRTYGYPVGAYFIFNGKEEAEGAPKPPPPNGKLLFWDRPFPRAGVHTLNTSDWKMSELTALDRLKMRANERHG